MLEEQVEMIAQEEQTSSSEFTEAVRAIRQRDKQKLENLISHYDNMIKERAMMLKS